MHFKANTHVEYFFLDTAATIIPESDVENTAYQKLSKTFYLGMNYREKSISLDILLDEKSPYLTLWKETCLGTLPSATFRLPWRSRFLARGGQRIESPCSAYFEDGCRKSGGLGHQRSPSAVETLRRSCMRLRPRPGRVKGTLRASSFFSMLRGF